VRRRPVDALKVPSIDPQFWVLKLLTTALGEAVSDALIKRFVAGVAWQRRRDRQVASATVSTLRS